MRINWKQNLLEYGFARLLGFLLGVFLCSFGASYLYDSWHRGIETNNISKFGVATTGWGIIVLIAVIRKQLQLNKAKQIENT
jgi:hypothetical protein